jgi:hypothetical protein
VGLIFLLAFRGRLTPNLIGGDTSSVKHSPGPSSSLQESQSCKFWEFTWRSSMGYFTVRLVHGLIDDIFIHRSRCLVFLTTIPAIFSSIYHERVGIASLHYIALGIGLSLASQVNGRFMDRIYIHFKNKNGGIGEPEFRLRE